MACGFSQPWMSQTVGASSSKVITARSGGADWRCIEVNTDVPARITLAVTELAHSVKPASLS